MRRLTPCLTAALVVVTLLSAEAVAETRLRSSSVPNQCLDDVEVVRKQLEQTGANAETANGAQIPLDYANRIAVDALTTDQSKEALRSLIACLHNSRR